MSSYQQLIFPILRRFGAERVHNRTVRALAQRMRIGRAMLRGMAGHVPKRPVEVFGLSFPDELGVAAGFDKNAEIVAGLGCLGFGHVEVGTLTPMPQAGNPRPRIFRLTEDRALINRMGFLNRGVAETFGRIRRIPHTPEGVILGVSLGKQKDTELEEAARDYLFVMEQVYP
jgi:dihydroorotate dehydrogenase